MDSGFGQILRDKFGSIMFMKPMNCLMKISVKAHPKSRKTQVIKKSDTEYEVWVREAPDKGKANEAVIEALAEYFDAAKSRFKIISGKTSKLKIVEWQ